MSPSQGRYLHIEQHKRRIKAHRHPCLEQYSNPRSQLSREEDSSYLRPCGHCDRQLVISSFKFILLSVVYSVIANGNDRLTTTDLSSRISHWQSFRDILIASGVNIVHTCQTELKWLLISYYLVRKRNKSYHVGSKDAHKPVSYKMETFMWEKWVNIWHLWPYTEITTNSDTVSCVNDIEEYYVCHLVPGIQNDNSPAEFGVSAICQLPM
jgi:hypothetical protein